MKLNIIIGETPDFSFFFLFSGLGYVVGRGLSMAFDGDWHWALRGTPLLGLVAVALIIFVMKEPPRGEAEGHDQVLKPV